MLRGDEKNEDGRQAYLSIVEKYGHVGWECFTRTLTNGRGQSNVLACILMQWILNWYRPKQDGHRRFVDRLYLPSAKLAREWNVSDRVFKDARLCVSRNGLASFKTSQHTAWIKVDWDRVESCVREYVEFKSNLDSADDAPDVRLNGSLDAPDVRLNGSLDAPDVRLNGSLDAPDVRLNVHIPPTSSLFSSLPLGEGAGEDREREIERHVLELVNYGRKRGRECRGEWLKEARASYAQKVDSGLDPNLIDEAYKSYIDVFENASKASDLGHWLRDLDLRGRAYDYGMQSFDFLYARSVEKLRSIEAEKEKEVEQKRRQVDEDARYRREIDGWYVDCGELGENTFIAGSEGVQDLKEAKRLHGIMVAKIYRKKLSSGKRQADGGTGKPSERIS